MMVWSLVVLALCFAIPVSCIFLKTFVIRFAGSGKNGFAYYPVLCCLHLCDVPYPFRHLGGIALFWLVWCLPILSLGDRALVLIFWSPRIHYVICHWSDNRWWWQSQATISRISAFYLGMLTANFYKHCCWQRPSDIRSMRVGCSRGSEAP